MLACWVDVVSSVCDHSEELCESCVRAIYVCSREYTILLHSSVNDSTGCESSVISMTWLSKAYAIVGIIAPTLGIPTLGILCTAESYA